ncbi:MAG: zinc-dependent metalloprotease [Pseudoflavonifractor sp.]|nr:zinc-dependent metalloprotease [Pseudoflavonifractor sp.]
MRVPKLPAITLATAALFTTAAVAGSSSYMADGRDHVDNSQRELLFFKSKKKKKHKKHDEDTSVSTDSIGGTYRSLTGEGSTVSDGLFKVIHKGDDYYYEIPLSLLGRDMLVVNKLVRVPKELNDAGVNKGINYDNQMIRFEIDRKTNKLFVRQSRPLPIVPEDASIARSVRDNYISPLIADFKIESFNTDSTAVVIKVDDIYDGTKTSINNVFANINLGTSVKKDLSRILSIKSFENNVYALSELTTKVNEPGGSVYVTVEVGSSILLLPEKPMARRFVSPKVGYFSESLLNYSDTQQRVKHGHYITRWRLEPKDGEETDYLAGRLVEPKKPIIFYIDNSTPPQWRPYIKKGIEEWQRAFEMAGFKNAIQAREITDSIEVDMDDMNYSVLTYAASTKSNAMGPSITDPRSGEILEADIMWWHNVLDILNDWIVVQTGAVNPDARRPELPEELIGDAMRFVACHEVGHSLGLRHNMMASSAIPTDSLRSRSYTDMLNSTSSSIMDYARFNYVAQPGDGVRVLSPNLGPYDMMAIEYGYRWYGKDTPEEEYALLQDFLSNYDHRLYKYCEAQDMRDAVDPRGQNEDLGDNPVKSSKYGIANLKRIVPNIVNWTTTGEPGQNYDEASRLYYSVIGQWNRYLYHALANVGGIYVDNTTVGDGARTYTFVDKDRQKESVKFLIDEVFTHPSWLFDADVANYTYLVSNTPFGQIEYAPSLILKNIQSYLLWDLMSDNRIVRMLENEASSDGKAFTAIEMFDMLHKGIFATTERGVVPDVRTRSMQKNFVDALIIAASENEGVKDGSKRSFSDCLTATDTYMCGHDHGRNGAGDVSAGRRTLHFYGSQANRISDAISIKRGELMRVRDLLSRSVTTDAATRYHYKDLVMRINTALGLPQK